MAEIIAIREFARRVGVSDAAVRKHIFNAERTPRGCLKESYVPDEISPKIKWELGYFEWIESGRGVKNPDLVPPEDPRPKSFDKQTVDAVNSGHLGDISYREILKQIDPKTSTLEAIRRKEVATAGLKELELSIKMGEVVPKQQVYAALFEYGQEISSALAQIAIRVAPFIKGLTTNEEAALEVIQKVEKEIEDFHIIISRGPKETSAEDEDA